MSHPEDNQSADYPAAGRARVLIQNQLDRLIPMRGIRLKTKLRSACRRWLDLLVRRPQREQTSRPNACSRERIFSELAAQGDFDAAIRLLLRQLVPHPQQAFAAVVESTEIDDQPFRSRGLCQVSRRTLTVGDDLREALTFQASLTLTGKELRDHEIFQNLEICDRRKVEQLYLIRLGDARQGFDVLVTSELLPDDLSPLQRLAFTEDTVTLLSGLWTKSRAIRTQLAAQETDEAFAALQIHLKPINGNLLQTISKYVDQLQRVLDVDRVSLLVPRGLTSTTRLAVSGPALPPGIEKAWRGHENILAAACVDQGSLLRFDTPVLRSLAIDTLIGGAVTAPIMIDGCVGAVLCLTFRNGWPIPIRVQRLVRGCSECIQDTLLKLRAAGENKPRVSPRMEVVPRKAAAAPRQVENQAVRAKSEFLATMSYEIRNPVHEFWSMSQADFDTDLDDAKRECVEPHSLPDKAFITLVDNFQDGVESPGGWRVLLADDDPMSRLIGREILQKQGHHVTVVHDGAAAVATVQQHEFDFVLLDLNMPEVDGYSAARRIRRWERKRDRRTLLIALTGDCGVQEQAACREADMDGCLAKPLDIHLLRKTLAALAEMKPILSDSADGLQSASAVIHYDALLARVEGDTLLAKELLEMFVTGGSKYLADIRSAIENHDFNEARHAALQLNSAALTIGANTLASISLRMDDVAAGQLDDAKTIYRDLEKAIDELQHYATSLD